MKIYLSQINESWIIDRIRDEWYQNNKDISTKFLIKSDIIWIISPWMWQKIPIRQLQKKKVICSIYHIDLDDKNNFDLKNFEQLEPYVDQFHVISRKTRESLKKLTNKKITSIPFWINQNNWFHIENKTSLRDEFGINQKKFLLGSFQRDTEGHDLISPKLIKGPDIFFKIVQDIFKRQKNLEVVLAGSRRQYLIKKLEESNIPFKYFEMANIETLNKLYNMLDLYIVSSRLEGGPQSIVECGITKTPIISTNVGVAPEILSSESIYENKDYKNAKPNIEYAYEKSKYLTIPNGMKEYIKLFTDIYEN